MSVPPPKHKHTQTHKHSAPYVTLCLLRALLMGSRDQKMKRGSQQVENVSENVCAFERKKEWRREMLWWVKGHVDMWTCRETFRLGASHVCICPILRRPSYVHDYNHTCSQTQQPQQMCVWHWKENTHNPPEDCWRPRGDCQTDYHIINQPWKSCLCLSVWSGHKWFCF